NHRFIGVRARTLDVGKPVQFKHTILSLATTPSGDRFYVITDSEQVVHVLDRYQDRVTADVDLPGRARDVRVDPFGRFVLVKSAVGDSVWVVAVGTDKLVGTVHSSWRADVPFVAPDGA